MNRPLRPQMAALLSVLALALLSACGDTASSSSGAASTPDPSRSGGAAATSDNAASSSASSSSASSTSASSTSASSTAGYSADGGRAVTLVSCTDQQCTVTLGGGGSRVQVMGITIAFTEIAEGRARLRADDRDVSFTAGQSETVGQARLTCTEVRPDRVTLTVTRA